MLIIVDNTMDRSQANFLPLLIKLLKEEKVKYRLVRNTRDLKDIKMDNVSGVILSGSPLMMNNESFIPNLEQYLINTYTILQYEKPTLGICFGCQLINNLWGGKLRKLRKPFCEDAKVYMGGETFMGKFCLSYVIKNLSDNFDVLGLAEIRKMVIPCVIKHKSKPIWGTLFHPEYHEYTHFFIKDFIKSLK